MADDITQAAPAQVVTDDPYATDGLMEAPAPAPWRPAPSPPSP